MSNAPFRRSQYLAIRAAAVESGKADHWQAARIDAALRRAATPPAPRRGLLGRMLGRRVTS